MEIYITMYLMVGTVYASSMRAVRKVLGHETGSNSVEMFVYLCNALAWVLFFLGDVFRAICLTAVSRR
jgi:hypothetical protein